MKKLIIVIMLLIGAIHLGFSQDSVKIPIPDSTKLSVGKVYNDVKTGLTGLGKALKVGAEHVYYILVKQQVVNSIVWIILLIVSFLFILNVMKAFKSTEKWWDSDEEMATWVGIIRVLQISGSVIGFTLAIFHINAIIMGFVNPEYGAIKDIFDFVK